MIHKLFIHLLTYLSLSSSIHTFFHNVLICLDVEVVDVTSTDFLTSVQM